MAASLLAVGTTTIRNVPDIADVDIMADLLTRLGCTVKHDGSVVTSDVHTAPLHRADYDLDRHRMPYLQRYQRPCQSQRKS